MELEMFKRNVDRQSIQQQFRGARALLVNVVGSLTRIGGPVVSTAAQYTSRFTQALSDLEQSTNDYLNIRQSQLGALMGVGRAINSSLGLNRVLAEVMDTLIELMRADRGFLMLRESTGELMVRIGRGIAHVSLEEASFKVSQTVVRRVAERGEPVLTTNAQNDPRFVGQVSIAIFQLRSILCAPLKIKNDLKGEEIPFPAPIIPVIDVYATLISNRPYRSGLPVDQVREMIRRDSRVHFDPQVVEAFLAMEDLSV
jgi:GAF domain